MNNEKARKMLETLVECARAGDLRLIKVKDKKTGDDCYVICGVTNRKQAELGFPSYYPFGRLFLGKDSIEQVTIPEGSVWLNLRGDDPDKHQNN